MKRIVFLWALLWTAAAHAEKIVPTVDYRVELLGIAARMAGFEEYSFDINGDYAADIDRELGHMKGHALVGCMKHLREEYSIRYNAIPSIAVGLEWRDGRFALIECDENLMDDRWGAVDKEHFLELLSAFYVESGFASFFEAHRPFYDRAVKAYEEQVMAQFDPGWCSDFYGYAPSERYRIIIGCCNGPCNYGVAYRRRGEKKDIYAVIGCAVDEMGAVRYGGAAVSILIHEFNHSYANPLLDVDTPSGQSLVRSVGYLYQTVWRTMQDEAYSEWESVLQESLVRAITIIYLLDKDFPEEIVKDRLMYEIDCGFRWMPELVRLMRKYRKKQGRYETFEAFYPQVAAEFERIAAREKRRIERSIS